MTRPGPKAPVVVLAGEDREKLERSERAATSEQREVLRARIILQAAAGECARAVLTTGALAPGRPRRGHPALRGSPRRVRSCRHGTRTLLAAFHVHTGHVLGRCGPRRRAEDLLGFLEDVAAYYPTQRVEVVWDNRNIHSGRRWRVLRNLRLPAA